ncbi:MAG: PKD domain-containing protein, partial [Planctomycetia bacterium]|nr:PKD domain-containing protein [Planctomycetia bacterium]
MKLDGDRDGEAGEYFRLNFSVAPPPISPPTKAGGEFRVNTTTNGDQRFWEPTPEAAAMDADGDFVVTWSSQAQDGSGWGVFAQRFAANGTPAGAEFQVNTSSLNNQQFATVAMDPDGDFVITWSALVNDTVNLGVYARRYHAAGAPQGEEFLVSPENLASQRLSVAAMDALGNTLLAWSELDPAGGADPASNIRARLFDADGVALGPSFQVNTTTVDLQRQASVARNGAGQFVVVWRSRGQDGDSDGVFARIFAADGTPLTGELQVNQFATGQQIRATVAMDAAGNFVVTWYNQLLGDSAGAIVPREIYARRFAANGSPLGDEFRVNTTTGSDQRFPSIAMDQDGDFAIAWSSFGQDGSDWGVYLQSFDATGARIGAEQLVNTTTANWQVYPVVAMDDDGDFVVAWSSLTQDGDGYGIYAQRYTQPQGFSHPQVTGVYPLADDHAVAEGERLVQQSAILIVPFSTSMRTGTGGDSVTNKSNWRLSRNGVDVSAQISSVTFEFDSSDNRYEAFIVLAAPLAEGNYELRAEPSIHSAAGFALDGNFNGVGGDAFERSFRVALPIAAGNEFRVNTFATGDQFFAPSAPGAVGADAFGNFVVVWNSAGQDGSAQGIYGQRFDAAGVPLGNEFRVNTFTSGDQRLPTVAVSPSGNFVVSWTSALQDGSGEGVYAQRYAADGAPNGSEFRVNTTTQNSQTRSSVSMDDSGNFVVAWESIGQDGNEPGVYYQRFAADGVKLGDETRANTFTTGSQRLPHVAVDTDGDFVITWSSNIQDGSGYGVYARRFTAVGVPLGGEFRVNTATAGDQKSSAVAMSADGDFAIVWQDSLADGSSDAVFLQRFTASGVPLGSNIQVNTTTANSQSNPTVGMDADGDLVVTWQSLVQDGGLWGVYARRYAWNGAPQTGEFLVNTRTTGNQVNANLAVDQDGDFIIAWMSFLQDGSGQGISAQRYQAFVNTPPTAVAGEYAIDEGDSLTLDGSASFDPDAGQTLAYSWDVNGDGVFGDVAGVSPVLTWAQLNALGIANDGQRSVRLRVTDSAGASTENVGVLTILDVAPSSVTLGQPPSVAEGSVATLTGSFVDPGLLDTQQVIVNWGDGTIATIDLPLGARTFLLEHRYADDNPTGTSSDQYPITVTVSGDGATSAPVSTSITVNNSTPSISELNRSASTISEGATLTLTGSFTDPGLLDTHSILIGWGDGTASAATVNSATRTFAATHVYGDEEPTSQPTITVTVTDDDGGVTASQTSVTVQNVAPSLFGLQLSAATIDEGGTVTLSGSYADAGALDTHTVLIGWGDGVATLAPLNTASRTFTATHTYRDDNPSGTPADQYPINLTINDDDNGVGAAQTTITVRNVAPSNLQLDPLEAYLEGSEVTLTGRFDDPGALDSHTVTIDWGDGKSAVLELPIGDRSFAAQHMYLDDNHGEPYLAAVTISDDDEGSVTAQREIQISNAPPEIVDLQVTPGTVAEGGMVTLTGVISDLGRLDSHMITVDWGDGTSTEVEGTGIQFEDNFESGPSPLWQNESGDWFVDASVYNAGVPRGNQPLPYTSLPFEFADFVVEFDVNDICDGGVFLRSTSSTNGVVLVIGGDGCWDGSPNPQAGRDLYWHVFVDGVPTPPGYLNRVSNLFIPHESNARVKVEVAGDTYRAFIDGVLQSTLVTDAFQSGRVALVDAYNPGHSFDNFVLTTPHTFTAAHQYLDDDPSGTPSDVFPISVTVTDDDDGVGQADAAVTVNNVAPSVAITAIPIVVTLGQPFTLQALVSDVGVLDTHELAWLVTRNGETVGAGAGEEFTFTPLQQGIHLFTLTGTDDDGGAGMAQIALEVAACDLPGDTNDDCAVNVVDLNNVRNNFGETGLGAVDLSFNAPVAGTIAEKDGVGTGFTHRLPGTGGALPANDPNLDLEPGAGGRLRIRSTQADINGALNLPQLEALGVVLDDIRGIDVQVSVVLRNVQLPNASDQITIYIAPDAGTTLRAGIVNSNSFVFTTNVGAGDVNVFSAPGAFDNGDDLELKLARTNGVWTLSWNNLSDPVENGALPGQELPWLNDLTQLYAGVLVANARNPHPFTATIDDFTVDILRPIPGDSNGDYIVDL